MLGIEKMCIRDRQGAAYIAVFALIYVAWGLAYTCLLYTSHS